MGNQIPSWREFLAGIDNRTEVEVRKQVEEIIRLPLYPTLIH